MLFIVWTYDPREDDKHKEATEVVLKVVEPFLRKIPSFKSVKTFMRRGGLGQRPIFQTWVEIENMKAIDDWFDFMRKSEEYPKVWTAFKRVIKNYNASIMYPSSGAVLRGPG